MYSRKFIIVVAVASTMMNALAMKLTQNDGEFALSGKVSSALAGVKIPPILCNETAKFDVEDFARHCESAVAARLKKGKLKELVNDRRFIVNVLALDAIRTAGATNLSALVAKDAKYATFMKSFFADAEFLTLYAGAGLVPRDTGVGIRVMADIWFRDGKSADFDKRLAAGIGAAWGAGPLSDTLQQGELLPHGDGNRCDPVWRYFFFRQSEREGLLHPNYSSLRPWEIRFIVGNRWDDESLWWLQKRVNLPWDQYGWACWVAKYTGMSIFGATVQGALFTVHAPTAMGSGENTVLHGGVCGALSHTGCHAAAAHGIPAYTAGQPGHCAYGFRLERGKWIGGFGGPDGSPHNWIFPGNAPDMVDLMESAFKNDTRVDRCVVLLAIARAGSDEAWKEVVKAWPYNYYVQQEYLGKLRSEGKDLAKYATTLLKPYAKKGFALVEVLKPFNGDIVRRMDDASKVKWYLALNKAIASSPASWTAKNLSEILDGEAKSLNNDNEADFVSGLFSLYNAGSNNEAFGTMLGWTIDRYVGNGRDEVFTKALSGISSAQSTKGGKPVDGGIFSKAIISAEKAGSITAVTALTQLAKSNGLGGSGDNGSKLELPANEKLVSDKGMLSISSTCNWDKPVAHLDVLSDVGGVFHTDKETGNWALVKLPESVAVSSIILAKNAGNESRTRHVKVSRSTDGATFFTVAETNDMGKEWRIDAKGEMAQWIKVERLDNEPDFFHLRNILIFTEVNK